MAVEVVDQGQVKRLVLPDQWKETAIADGDEHAFRLREFSPDDNPEVRLCFFYRGYPFATETGQAFKTILAAPPHSLPAKEIRTVAEILEDISRPELFKSLAIHTQNINGKSVLLVEGRWLRQNWDTYSLFIIADDEGCVVQQIYLLAPSDAFPRYIKDVRESLKNTEWVS